MKFSFAALGIILSTLGILLLSGFFSPPDSGELLAPVSTYLEDDLIQIPGREIPGEIYYCVNDLPGRRVDLAASFISGEETYYLVNVYYDLLTKNPLVSSDYLVKRINDPTASCHLINEEPASQPLSKYVSPDIAYQLEHGRFKRYVNISGGKQAFQRLLTRWLTGGNRLDSQQIAVLKSLGISTNEENP